MPITWRGSCNRGIGYPVDLLRVFRIVSLLEATSFLLLLASSVLKRTNEWETGVSILGPTHGVLFIAYVALVFMTRSLTQWTNGRVVLALVASVLPVAPYYVERTWLRQAEAENALRQT